MRIVASLSPENIATLMDLLKKENISCESRIPSDEIGLETTELLVPEADYDRACDIVENWQDADYKSKLQRKCPKCAGIDWEPVPDAHYEQADLTVYRCKSCGSLVPMQ